MTTRVRTTYRRHRTVSSAMALILVAAFAAVAIPFASGATKTLVFSPQPPSAWQKAATITPALGVQVLSDGQPANQGGTPTLAVAAGSAGTTSDFDFGSSVYNSGQKRWTWPNAKPKAGAPSGLYTFVATLGSLVGTSNQFRVADLVCASKQNCSAQSNSDPTAKGAARFNIANSLADSVALDFGPGGTGSYACSPWNRTFYTDANGQDVLFPAVTLNFTGTKMLQVDYLIRNSEWVQTNSNRGNSDIDFCVQARHQDASLNDGNHPFNGKYADGVRFADGYYNGVIGSVANPSKVTSDPVVCKSGNASLPTGPGGVNETWRSWTICIPYDWDWGIKGG